MHELTTREIQALRHIRNSIIHRGRTPSVRELMQALNYKSPKSAQDVLALLIEKRALKKLPSGDYQLVHDASREESRAQTVDIPIVGAVAAGTPILADENVEGFLPISTRLARPGSKHFLLRVRGDSMNRAGIDDGDFVLVRQQATAEPGQRVVALIDDEATVKEYAPGKDVVLLKPRSTNPAHKPIVLDRDFQIQGVVVTAINNLE